MCYHSNGVFVGFQPGGRSAEMTQKEEKKVAKNPLAEASGVSEQTSYLCLSVVYLVWL